LDKLSAIPDSAETVVEHLEKKIEYLTDTTIAKIDNLKDTMTSPDFKLLETKLNKVTRLPQEFYQVYLRFLLEMISTSRENQV
jgi:hypothetical protein